VHNTFGVWKKSDVGWKKVQVEGKDIRGIEKGTKTMK
jgi:hypothetical protein